MVTRSFVSYFQILKCALSFPCLYVINVVICLERSCFSITVKRSFFLLWLFSCSQHFDNWQHRSSHWFIWMIQKCCFHTKDLSFCLFLVLIYSPFWPKVWHCYTYSSVFSVCSADSICNRVCLVPFPQTIVVNWYKTSKITGLSRDFYTTLWLSAHNMPFQAQHHFRCLNLRLPWQQCRG